MQFEEVCLNYKKQTFLQVARLTDQKSVGTCVFFDKIYQLATFCNFINRYPGYSLIYR